MDNSNNTPPLNGEHSTRMPEQTSSRQLLPNETTTRSGDQTCTQKLTIPSLKEYHSSSANLWWRKFVQNVKMTKGKDNVKRDFTTMPGTAGIRYQGNISLGNWTECAHEKKLRVRNHHTS